VGYICSPSEWDGVAMPLISSALSFTKGLVSRGLGILHSPYEGEEEGEEEDKGGEEESPPHRERRPRRPSEETMGEKRAAEKISGHDTVDSHLDEESNSDDEEDYTENESSEENSLDTSEDDTSAESSDEEASEEEEQAHTQSRQSRHKRLIPPRRNSKSRRSSRSSQETAAKQESAASSGRSTRVPARQIVEAVDLDVPVELVFPCSQTSPALARMLQTIEDTPVENPKPAPVQESPNAPKREWRRLEASELTAPKQHGEVVKKSPRAGDLQYDADSEDEAFVKQLTSREKQGKKRGAQPCISLQDLEQLFEFLEHLAYMRKLLAWNEQDREELAQILEGLEAASKAAAAISDNIVLDEETSRIDKSLQVAVGSEVSVDMVCNLLRAGNKTKTDEQEIARNERWVAPDLGDKTVLFPLNRVAALSHLANDRKLIGEILDYWKVKREKFGELVRRFQVSDLLQNWSIMDSVGDELGRSLAEDTVERHLSKAIVSAVMSIRDDMCHVEELCNLVHRRESLKLALCQPEHAEQDDILSLGEDGATSDEVADESESASEGLSSSSSEAEATEPGRHINPLRQYSKRETEPCAKLLSPRRRQGPFTRESISTRKRRKPQYKDESSPSSASSSSESNEYSSEEDDNKNTENRAPKRMKRRGKVANRREKLQVTQEEVSDFEEPPATTKTRARQRVTTNGTKRQRTAQRSRRRRKSLR